MNNQTDNSDGIGKAVKRGFFEGISTTVKTVVVAFILAVLAYFGINLNGANGNNEIPTFDSSSNNPISNNALSSSNCASYGSLEIKSTFDLVPGNWIEDSVYRSGHFIMLSDDWNYVYVQNNYAGYWEDEGYISIASFSRNTWSIVHTFNNIGQGAFAVCIDNQGSVHGAVVDWSPY